MGLDSAFEQNEKTSDYFKCQQIDDLVNERTEFETLAQAKLQLLNPINACFGAEASCILTGTQSYVRLMCKFANCPFQIWYTYDAKQGMEQPAKIKFFRKINNNHSFDCHKKAVLKDKKFLIL